MPLPEPPFDMDRLPRGSPVRKLLAETHERDDVPRIRVELVIRLLRDPSPWRYEEREAAAWSLGNARLRPTDRDSAGAALTVVLADALPPDIIEIWRSLLDTVAPAVLLAVGAACVAAASMNYLPLIALSVCVPACLASGALLTLIPTRALARKIGGEKGLFNRLRAAAAEALGKLAYRDAVGTLAEALFDPSPDVRESAESAFGACVGALRPRDLGTLRPKTGKQLCAALKHPHSGMVSTVLDALEKVGESPAIPHISRLAIESDLPDIRARAETVLATLEKRKKNEKYSRRLVRPSTAPEDDAEKLLRTAIIPDMNPESLVRPAQSEVVTAVE